MIRPVHPNKERIFTTAEMHPDVSPSPGDKFYRYRPDQSIQNLADQLRKYITVYRIDRYHIRAILLPKFGSSVGNDTFMIFINPVYGAGMRPRKETLAKYRYLLSRLKEIHKEFEDTSCNTVDM